MKSVLSFVALSVAVVLIIACNSANKKGTDQLGEIDFPVHANNKAQPFFQKGLLLLHSFEYEDAAENFIEAEKLDPSCVMAYWGEAMTYNHPLWRQQDYEKGKDALDKLAGSPEDRRSKATSDLEKDFITATDQLYGKGSKAQRDSAYAAYMGELYKKYPGNNEVAAFYSVALLGSVEVGRDDKVYEHAAEIAKEVLSRNPNHPGALHYLIHSYDDPAHAALALDAADKYSVVAPAAGHALHMPSHIYLALGMWDKVVSSNEASWSATVARKQNKNLKNNALGYHYFHWLQYGYLQQGRKKDAKRLLDEMKVYCDTLPAKPARRHLVYMKSTYLVESNDWNSDAANIRVDLSGLNIPTRAMYYFVEGMKSYNGKDGKALSETILTLNGERLQEAQKVSSSSIATCMSVNENTINLLDVQQAEVMELELRALEAWLKKDTATTSNFFRKATALENSISYSFGPPVIVKPSNELYGEWLLEMNKPRLALEQFNLSLKAAPNRVLSLQGKMKAAFMTGDKEIATQAEKTLQEISSKGSEMGENKNSNSKI
jgi:tetratricopeptide (TPR) repeat protein